LWRHTTYEAATERCMGVGLYSNNQQHNTCMIRQLFVFTFGRAVSGIANISYNLWGRCLLHSEWKLLDPGFRLKPLPISSQPAFTISDVWTFFPNSWPFIPISWTLFIKPFFSYGRFFLLSFFLRPFFRLFLFPWPFFPFRLFPFFTVYPPVENT
jgi:hypothetical protein